VLHFIASTTNANAWCVVAAGTAEPKKEQAAVTGSQGKSSVAGLDASSHVTGAASALIALSTLRENCGR
jgi:hypothetical protein